MARKKSKKAPAPAKLSPEKYIQTKARSLPLNECFYNPNWQSSGLATLLITRTQPSGNLVAGVYLVDVYCLGLKNTYYFFNKSVDFYEEELLEMVFQGQEYEPCDYVLAHNIIYGAIAYAEDLGFQPQKDFAVSRYVLEEDDESVELLDLEFGKDGQPCYITGPFDNAPNVISKLKTAVGEGNFTVIHAEDYLLDDESEDEEAEPDEEDFDEFDDVTAQNSGTFPASRTTDPPNGRSGIPQLHLSSYTISYEPMRDESHQEYYQRLGSRVEELYKLTAEQPRKAIPVLEELILQYPLFPVLQNYLAVAYMNAGHKEESEQLVEQTYQAFPEYLIARLNYARVFLNKGEPDRVAEILENKFEIKLLLPDRDVFHFTEVINYTALVAEYFIEKGAPDKARPYVNVLEKIDAEHPMTRQAVFKLMSYRLTKGLKKLLGRKS